MSEEREAELSQSHDQAWRDLDKATTIGAYIISSEAATLLEEFRRRPGLDWDENPASDVYEDEAKSYTKALNDFRDIAKKDLGVDRQV